MSAMEVVIYTTISLVMLGVGYMFIYMNILFKHRVRVIDLGKQCLEFDYKARDVVKDGVSYWQLDKEKNKELKYMPVPPANAINIAKKGKKSIECIRTETGEYIFLERGINTDEIPDFKDVKDVKERVKKFTEWREKHKGMVLEGTYKPFTTKQRMIIVNNFEKGKARKGFNLIEHIPTMVALGSFTIMVVCLMIFWGDIAKPALDSKMMTTTHLETQKEIVSILRDIKTNQQTITSSVQSNTQKIDNLENAPD